MHYVYSDAEEVGSLHKFPRQPGHQVYVCQFIENEWSHRVVTKVSTSMDFRATLTRKPLKLPIDSLH